MKTKIIDPPFKIFLSAPDDYWLSANQKAVKDKLIAQLQADGFEVELMGSLGMPFTQEKTWDHERTEKIIQCCQGAIILGLPRWYDALALPGGQPGHPNSRSGNLVTEYSHSEGALAFAHHLPTLFLIEDGVVDRGVLHRTNTLIGIPQGANDTFITTNAKFLSAYEEWVKKVRKRYHIFFGYSGGAQETAAKIIKFLRSKGIRVRDWQKFQSVGTILEQIEKADQTCLGGLFLFTSDDKLTSKAGSTQVPRDNVIFEAGYFVSSKSDKRVQVILEDRTKLLADLGGIIYLPLKDRDDISPIKKKLVKFVQDISQVS